MAVLGNKVSQAVVLLATAMKRDGWSNEMCHLSDHMSKVETATTVVCKSQLSCVSHIRGFHTALWGGVC